ncbi:MAG: DNA mismatch endonuclease Vsr [Chlorobaculum sp.]|nr:DNA mismatch endonuclease Vsr [Chlorobaculum sp.]
MTDTLSPSARSERMGRIRSKNTQPELILRKILREIGFAAYRLHRVDLPGKPDIAFISKKKAIFVHGCFWHQHGCGKYKMPKSRNNYWLPKLIKNIERDKENIEKLRTAGWSVLTVWECELKDVFEVSNKILRFLS